MDDLLEVETRVKELGGASVTLIQTIMRGDQRLVEAEVTVVLVSVSGKPLRLSEAVRRAFLAQTQAQDPGSGNERPCALSLASKAACRAPRLTDTRRRKAPIEANVGILRG